MERSCVEYNKECYNMIHETEILELDHHAHLRADQYSQYGFIHVGKCGGTEVLRHFKGKIKEIHWEDNPAYWQSYRTKWILWVRNPFARFVSAFWYSYNGINIPCNELVSCPHRPIQVHESLGIPTHTDIQKYGFNIFKSPNELAEALSSDNIKLKKLAEYMLTNGGEHLPNGLAYYLDDGNWLDNNNNIIFVGECEKMSEDIDKMVEELGNELCYMKKEIKHSRRGHVGNKYLSVKAINNLKEFWKDTEMKTIYKLYVNNFISFSTYMNYNTYEYIL